MVGQRAAKDARGRVGVAPLQCREPGFERRSRWLRLRGGRRDREQDQRRCNPDLGHAPVWRKRCACAQTVATSRFSSPDTTRSAITISDLTVTPTTVPAEAGHYRNLRV